MIFGKYSTAILLAILVVSSGCSALEPGSSQTECTRTHSNITTTPIVPTTERVSKTPDETITDRDTEWGGYPPGVDESTVIERELLNAHTDNLAEKSFLFHHTTSTTYVENDTVDSNIRATTKFDNVNLTSEVSTTNTRYDIRFWSNSSRFVRVSVPNGTDSIDEPQYGTGVTDIPAIGEWTYQNRFNTLIAHTNLRPVRQAYVDGQAITILESEGIRDREDILDNPDEATVSHWRLRAGVRRDGVIRNVSFSSKIGSQSYTKFFNRTYRFTRIGEDIDTRPAWVDDAIARAPKLRADRADSGHHYALTNDGPSDIPAGTEVTVDFTDGGVLTTNLSRSLDAGETAYLYVVADEGEVRLRSTRERPGPAAGIRLGERAEIHLNRVVDGSEFFLGTAEVGGGHDGE